MSETDKRRALIALIAISLLPSVFLMQFPPAVNSQTLSLWGASVIGYAGITLLLWMYMLGTRSVTGLIFSDLAPVLRIHKWLGKYGVLAIFLHPLLAVYSYGYSLLYVIWPTAATTYENHVTLGRIAFWALVFTWVISALLRDRMAFRPWKYTHYLTYIVVPFALLHVPEVGIQEQTHVLVKGYLLMLGLVFAGFSVLRLRSIFNFDKFAYTVDQQLQITELDYLIRLLPHGPTIVPSRGQYVYIKLGFLSEDHPFSVTQYEHATGEITLAYRTSGMYTRELAKLEEGHDVLLSGPYGSFTEELTPENDIPVVYISGGIGITPFVERILHEDKHREQWLFAANRSRDTAVLVPAMRKKLGARCVSIYTQPVGQLGAGEETGYLTAEILQKYIGVPNNYHYYLCGPPPMMAAARGMLDAIGVPSTQVKTETFGW